jgi:hypothetical protein
MFPSASFLRRRPYGPGVDEATAAPDILLILFNALSEREQDDVNERLTEQRLRRIAGDEGLTARYLRSLRRVAEQLGHTPSTTEYRQVSEELRAAGEDVEIFSRLYARYRRWHEPGRRWRSRRRVPRRLSTRAFSIGWSASHGAPGPPRPSDTPPGSDPGPSDPPPPAPPHQMILRQPLRQRRRHQQQLTALNTHEFSSHPRSVINPPDSTDFPTASSGSETARRVCALAGDARCFADVGDLAIMIACRAPRPRSPRCRGNWREARPTFRSRFPVESSHPWRMLRRALIERHKDTPPSPKITSTPAGSGSVDQTRFIKGNSNATGASGTLRAGSGGRGGEVDWRWRRCIGRTQREPLG